ncbi:MAG: type II toxin-antitoxin system RelE/ParE family toxin [Verrucomicrobiaceae bacterium]|nr:type II toxin-antitoxin system RelE/ParE family toxin [Verrucomicrobiaceae bacterium]
MKIQILDLAKDDLIAGFRFYEKQEPGLGDYFLRQLYTDIDGLHLTAGIHLRPYRQYHRALSKRFPFAIFYTVENEAVMIRAIVDCRRRPSWIRRHLRGA